jgi:ribose transport system ATP-binding protein
MTDATTADAPLLQVRGLVKEYPGVRALDGVDFEVRTGQVHCLLGQNGAGKSTLIKCVSGVVEPTDGVVLWRGEELPVGDPAESLRRGIGTIYQELDLVDDLSIADNVFLGHEPRRGVRIDARAMLDATRALLGRLGHPEIDPSWRVGDLKPAQHQLTAIARALSRDVELLIMDEPSAILDDHEVETLFSVVRRLTAEGVGIVYITHRLDEIARIADVVTVVRNGQTVATELPAETSGDELVRLMVGSKPSALFPDRPVAKDEVVLDVRNVSRDPIEDASFQVRAGEVVGLAGLVGSGRTELLRLIYGLDTPTAGEVVVAGQTLQPGRPDLAIAAGLGMAPEERKSQALLLDWDLVKNVSLADLRRFRRGPALDLSAEKAEAARHLDALDTQPRNPEQIARMLSGGNQQKVVLARWLLRSCRVLLLDEPTRGVDVGARAEIYRVIAELAGSGLGVVVVSSELPELVGFCTRILVMREGRFVGEVDGADATEEDLLRLAVQPEKREVA